MLHGGAGRARRLAPLHPPLHLGLIDGCQCKRSKGGPQDLVERDHRHHERVLRTGGGGRKLDPETNFVRSLPRNAFVWGMSTPGQLLRSMVPLEVPETSARTCANFQETVPEFIQSQALGGPEDIVTYAETSLDARMLKTHRPVANRDVHSLKQHMTLLPRIPGLDQLPLLPKS